MYVVHHKPPGGFLQALFANDLLEVFARADDENAALIRQWVAFVYNYMPTTCHGSYEIVRAWLLKEVADE
jgi:hypothetical protein